MINSNYEKVLYYEQTGETIEYTFHPVVQMYL